MEKYKFLVKTKVEVVYRPGDTNSSNTGEKQKESKESNEEGYKGEPITQSPNNHP